MRKITVICDRCGDTCLVPKNPPELTIESEFCGAFDLCPVCTKELKEWLNGKNKGNEGNKS